ncbi:hypothetical protein [Candidatus Harpocratesius sp.]
MMDPEINELEFEDFFYDFIKKNHHFSTKHVVQAYLRWIGSSKQKNKRLSGISSRIICKLHREGKISRKSRKSIYWNVNQKPLALNLKAFQKDIANSLIIFSKFEFHLNNQEEKIYIQPDEIIPVFRRMGIITE